MINDELDMFGAPMEPRLPRRVIVQTYYSDDIDRGFNFTYNKFPKLERLSKQSVKLYADKIGADYVLLTDPLAQFKDNNTAHWGRMNMFHLEGYDEYLYVDCDILVNRHVIANAEADNVFELEGNAVPRIHFFDHTDYPDECNMGVLKFNDEERKIMRNNIQQYHNNYRNQAPLNECWREHVGEMKLLPYRWNVTHRPTKDMAFQHYAGSKKQKEVLKKCPIFKQWAR